jgi:hypothetical protein
MNRVAVVAAGFLAIAGCCTTDERDVLRPLPVELYPQGYGELLRRAHRQITLATEGYYTDDWLIVEDAARALEQTSRYLPKATDTPELERKNLEARSAELIQEAQRLREAARTKDAQKVNTSLQSLHRKIRSIRKTES